jgi:hypothetical protein
MPNMVVVNGSRQVIAAIPAVIARIIWWMARRKNCSLPSKQKSLRQTCSVAVMATLIERSAIPPMNLMK